MIQITSKQHQIIELFKKYQLEKEWITLSANELKVTRNLVFQTVYRLIKRGVFFKNRNIYTLTTEKLIITNSNKVRGLNKEKKPKTIAIDSQVHVVLDQVKKTKLNQVVVEPKSLKPIEYKNGRISKVPLPPR